ncbi:LPS export ABC transporter permease LptF [Desulfococcaceae bacterium HSG9]|nr:LPS export ABC transporter permease LptF [Desulfococcaceae bacterium HSG9]
MKINSIINRYLFVEIIPPFVIGVVFLTFIFLMTKILEITNMIVNYKVNLADVLLILIYSMPFFLEFVIPMSVMMAILLTFLRLSGDNEIIALKAGGVSTYRLIPPVLFFCIIGGLITAYMAIYGLPYGRMASKKLAAEIAMSHFDVAVKERTFNDSFKDVMLYVNKIDIKTKTLIDVFIEDRRTENIVTTTIAPKGKLFNVTDKRALHLRLYNGVINQVDLKAKSASPTSFQTYDLSLNLREAMSSVRSGPKDEEEMTLAELRQYIKTDTKKDAQYYITLMEFHKKFSLPFSCIALGVLAVPLGIQSKSSKKSFGIGLGMVCFLVYYMLLSTGWVFGEAGAYPPLLGMWVPNIVMGSLGLFLLVRTANEKSIDFDFVTRLLLFLKRRLAKRFTDTDEKMESKRSAWREPGSPLFFRKLKRPFDSLDYSLGLNTQLISWQTKYLSWKKERDRQISRLAYVRAEHSFKDASRRKPSDAAETSDTKKTIGMRIKERLQRDQRSNKKSQLQNNQITAKPTSGGTDWRLRRKKVPPELSAVSSPNSPSRKLIVILAGISLIIILYILVDSYFPRQVLFNSKMNTQIMRMKQQQKQNKPVETPQHPDKKKFMLNNVQKQLEAHEKLAIDTEQTIDRFERFESFLERKMGYLDQELERLLIIKETTPATGQGIQPTSPLGLSHEIFKPRYHLVKQGETLYGISHRYGLSVADLRNLNNLNTDDVISPGNIFIIRKER